MKPWLLVVWLLVAAPAGAQRQKSFSAIDGHMQSVEAPTPDSLARIVLQHYRTDLEKTRAIYSWVVNHVAYNTARLRPWTSARRFTSDPVDTATVWLSGDEMTARRVMRRRVAVCDGYARLFKVLCTYTGVEAVVVQGYARVPGESKFRTNHTWNAVRIDSAWHLLDVTWASGHLTGGDEYIVRQNDFYFLTPPAAFIADHYPEELQWTLLPAPPSFPEFKRSPFRSKNFYRYGVADYFPDRGLIEAAIGDTVHLSIALKDADRASRTGGDPFVDTTSYARWPASVFLKPATDGGTLVYTYVIQPGAAWINLLYNDDVLMRYRLQVRWPALSSPAYSRRE